MNYKRKESIFLLAASVGLITLAVYLPALKNEFVIWDDDVNIFRNIHIRFFDLSFLRWAFSEVIVGGNVTYWQPVVWISHALDYAFWGLNPVGHHLTNILLHAANTFLAVMLVFRLDGASREPYPSTDGDERFRGMTALATAGVAGILFGLHPLHVESVAWVSERKDLLYSLFFLLSILCYIKYALQQGKKRDHGAGKFYFDRVYVSALVFFLCSLASKPMAVTLPAVLLLLDWYPLKRLRIRRDIFAALIEKMPFVFLSLVISVVTLAAHGTAGVMKSLGESPLGERMLAAVGTVMKYLAKMVVPLNLSPYYPDPGGISLFSPDYLAALAFFCSVTVICLILARKNKAALSAWGYYLVVLLPVSGIVKTKSLIMADRFTYLGSLGPFVLVGMMVAWGWSRIDSMMAWKKTAQRIAGAAAILVLGAMTYVTVQQIAVWRDSVALWSHVIEKASGRVPTAYLNRGIAWKEQGRLDRALDDFTAVLAMDNTSTNAYNNRGLTYKELGWFDLALQDYTAAIHIRRDAPELYSNRGLVYKEMGRFKDAQEDFDTAIRLNPRFADAYTGRGWTYMDMGQVERALEEFTAAINLDPTGYIAYNNRGMAYLETDRPDLALQDFSTAIRLDPSFVQAYMNRGLAHEQMGQLDMALQDYTSAIRAAPSFASAYNNRGYLYQRMGRLGEALTDLDTAVRLDPIFVEAYNNRGLVHENTGKLVEAIADYSRAIELSPENYFAYSNRGIAYGKMGRHNDAVRDYQKACGGGIDAACEALRNL